MKKNSIKHPVAITDGNAQTKSIDVYLAARAFVAILPTIGLLVALAAAFLMTR